MKRDKRDTWLDTLSDVVRRLNDPNLASRRHALRSLIYRPSFIELSNAATDFNNWSDDDVSRFCDECLAFLRTLVQHAGRPGHASSPMAVKGPIVFRSMASRGRVYTAAWGTARDVMTIQLLTLVQRAGVERLRTCPAAGCQQLLVKVGKRTHCSTRCLNRETQRRKREILRVERLEWEASQTRSIRKGRR
jgi:hypothetical protein